MDKNEERTAEEIGASQEEQPLADELQSIMQTGSVTTYGKHIIHCLTIIGQIEGHYILPSQNKRQSMSTLCLNSLQLNRIKI